MKTRSLTGKLIQKLKKLVRRAYKRKGIEKNLEIVDILGGDWGVIVDNLMSKYEQRYNKRLVTADLMEISIHHIVFLETVDDQEGMLRVNNYNNLEILTLEDHMKVHELVK